MLSSSFPFRLVVQQQSNVVGYCHFFKKTDFHKIFKCDVYYRLQSEISSCNKAFKNVNKYKYFSKFCDFYLNVTLANQEGNNPNMKSIFSCFARMKH